jgi:aspartyl/asparaginyl-tRNA synthetase
LPQVELKATRVAYLGRTDATEYPLAKKKQSYEFLREKAHLRPRTNTIGAVARIRSALAFATHRFFQERGFLYVHTPIVTAADCEGAGEMFQASGAGREREQPAWCLPARRRELCGRGRCAHVPLTLPTPVSGNSLDGVLASDGTLTGASPPPPLPSPSLSR